MPTFETNTGAETAAAERLAATQEFRPRKRDWKGDLDETFNPAPIPPEVKKAIDQRIDNLMRQCRGPDETLFALREWWTGTKRIAARLWDLIASRLPWRKDDDDEEEVAEEAVSVPEEGEPRPGKPAAQTSSAQREQRGRRRHGRRGGSGNNGGSSDKGGQRDWRENSY
jgi:hypothetical protein